MRIYKKLKSSVLTFSILFNTALSLVTLFPAHAETTASQTSIENMRIPRFHHHRPQWGVEVTSSLNAFGGKALTFEQGTSPIYAFSLQIEYQPAFLQSFGVLGIGPSGTLYPPFNSYVTSGFAALWAVGGQVRYQARYFREQILVPMAAYSAEYFNYNFLNGNSGHLVAQGPTFGLWLLLNGFEKTTASELYASNGVSRSYLVGEYRTYSGNDAFLSYKGGSYYFGLRFEM